MKVFDLFHIESRMHKLLTSEILHFYNINWLINFHSKVFSFVLQILL